MTKDEKIAIQKISMPGVPLDALLDSIAKQGEQYIADGNEHAAQLFLLRKVGDGYAVEVIAVAPIPEGDGYVKDAMAEAMGHLVAPFDAYIFLTEAYFLRLKSRAEVAAVVGKVKDTPGRVECFTLHFVTKQGEQSRWISYEIKRDKERPYFGPKEESGGDMTEGRFVNFYLWARTPGEQGN